MMNEKPSFFAELKRRNVYKVAVAYAIVGWLDGPDRDAGFFHSSRFQIGLCGWSSSVVAIGFPIALVIAWAFELTPEGIKRT